MAHIVIAGASMAGLRAAEQLRAAGWEGRVTLVGDERHAPYNRPPLSKERLAGPGTVDEAAAALAFRPRRGATDLEWRLGTAVVGADLAARTLRLSDGGVLGYDGLVVATGLRPARVPAPGPLAGRHVVRTVEDAVALHAALVPGARVAVVGSGFIGCEVASTAVGLGCDVTLVEGATGPMERSVGRELSGGVRRLLADHNVRTLPGRRVAAFSGGAACTGVLLDDGARVDANVVVEAVGSHCNTEWLDGNGLDLSGGVPCDANLRVLGPDGTPLGDVVAVGDVARFPDAGLGLAPRRVEHWSTPTDTAKIAAPALVAGLAGAPVAPAAAPLPSFWSDVFGLRIQGVGHPSIADEVRVLEGDAADPAAGTALAYLRDGRLVGAVAAGLPAQKHLKLRQGVVDALAAGTRPEPVLAHP